MAATGPVIRLIHADELDDLLRLYEELHPDEAPHGPASVRLRGLRSWQTRACKPSSPRLKDVWVMLLTSSRDPGVHGFYEQAGFRGDVKSGYIGYPES